MVRVLTFESANFKRFKILRSFQINLWLFCIKDLNLKWTVLDKSGRFMSHSGLSRAIADGHWTKIGRSTIPIMWRTPHHVINKHVKLILIHLLRVIFKITCWNKIWFTFKLFEKWTLLLFCTNDCIENQRWIKVYFSNNLKVDQT